jgi:hypothetical protein
VRKSKTSATASRASRSLACNTPERASLGTTARALTHAKIEAKPAVADAMNYPACTPRRLQMDTPNPATAIAVLTSSLVACEHPRAISVRLSVRSRSEASSLGLLAVSHLSRQSFRTLIISSDDA